MSAGRQEESGAPITLFPGVTTDVQPPDRGDRLGDEKFVLWTITLLSSLGAALAPGSPTALAGWNVVLKLAVGALCALGGALTPLPALVATAIGATVFTAGSKAVVFGCLAVLLTGFGVVDELAGRKRDVRLPASQVARVASRAISGALICQAALRFSWPHTSLVPSAIAAGVMLVLVVPAVARTKGRARRWILGGVAVVILACVVVAVVSVLSVLAARGSITEGISTSELGLTAAKGGDQESASTDFATAHHQFGAAEGDLSTGVIGELLPGLSQQIHAVRVASGIGARVSAVAGQTVRRADISSLQVRHGQFPLRRIESLEPLFSRDHAVLTASARQAASVSSPWLLSELRSKLSEEATKLSSAGKDAETGLLAVRAVPPLLGADGRRTYLVLFENPAESRASGGVIGNYAQLTALDGRLHLDKVGSVGELNTAGHPDRRRLIGPADYIDRYSQFEPQLVWQNVPMSPDFPSVARVAAALYPQSGGTHVNGVISVDPVALAGFLAATGPIHNSAWPGTIDAGNVVADLANQEFVVFQRDEQARQQFLKTLIRQVWHSLVARPLPSIPSLTDDLLPALRGGHLLLYSSDRRAERFFRRTHVGGAMPRVGTDFLGVVTQNAAGNKLDWYLRRSIRYSAVIDPPAQQLTASLTLSLHDEAPSSGLPPMIISPSPGADTRQGEDELYVSVYTPWQETNATLDGKPLVMTSQQELGRFVYSALVKVPAGASVRLRLKLLGDWSRGRDSYRLVQFHQPVLFPDHERATVRWVG